MPALEDNVFFNLGFPEKEALDMQQKSMIVISINRLLSHKSVSLQKAAELSSVDCVRMEEVLQGGIYHASLQELTKWHDIIKKYGSAD